MSNIRTPLLVVAGGCAAMLAAAVGTVAMSSFYSDMPSTPPSAAMHNDVAPKVVKTIKLKPEAQIAEAAAKSAAAPVAPVAQPQAAQPTQVAAAKPVAPRSITAAPTAAATKTTRAHPVDINAKLESAFAAQGVSPAAQATNQELGQSGASFADLVKAKENGDAAELPQEVAQLPSPAPRAARKDKEQVDEDDESVSGRTISMRAGVNMRAAGKSGSRVILTIPAGAKVTLAPNCQHWCKVSYNGRIGYVYRSFINGGGKATRARARTAAPKKAEAAPAVAKPAQPQQTQAGLFGNGGIFGGKKTQGATAEN